jgi:hypothetical protein
MPPPDPGRGPGVERIDLDEPEDEE